MKNLEYCLLVICNNLVTLACIAGAVYLQVKDKPGFGWMLLIAILTFSSLKGKVIQETKKEE